MLCALPVFTELASTCLFHARCFSLLHFLCLEMAFSSCLSSTPLSLASLMHACLYNFSQFVVFSPFSPRSSLPLASTTSSVWIFSCNLAGHQGQDTCAAGAKLQSSRHLSFPFLSFPCCHPAQMIQCDGGSWGGWITWFPPWSQCPRKCQILWLEYYPEGTSPGDGGHWGSPWPFPS